MTIYSFPMIRKIKHNLFQILEHPQQQGWIGKIFLATLTSLILTNALWEVIETLPGFLEENRFLSISVLRVTIIFYTIEYILRLWVCTMDHRYRHPLWGRLRYALTFFPMIDLLAFLPFYLPGILPIGLRFVRLLRLFLLLPLFKLGRYSQATQTFIRVVRSKKTELFSITILVLFLIFFSASLVFFIENQAQPEVFTSIPQSMYWTIITLATVGYGDIVPITNAGKFLASAIAILGIGLFALPAGILASGYMEEMERKKGGKETCPHCGKNIHPSLLPSRPSHPLDGEKG